MHRVWLARDEQQGRKMEKKDKKQSVIDKKELCTQTGQTTNHICLSTLSEVSE